MTFLFNHSKKCERPEHPQGFNTARNTENLRTAEIAKVYLLILTLNVGCTDPDLRRERIHQDLTSFALEFAIAKRIKHRL